MRHVSFCQLWCDLVCVPRCPRKGFFFFFVFPWRLGGCPVGETLFGTPAPLAKNAFRGPAPFFPPMTHDARRSFLGDPRYGLSKVGAGTNELLFPFFFSVVGGGPPPPHPPVQKKNPPLWGSQIKISYTSSFTSSLPGLPPHFTSGVGICCPFLWGGGLVVPFPPRSQILDRSPPHCRTRSPFLHFSLCGVERDTRIMRSARHVYVFFFF